MNASGTQLAASQFVTPIENGHVQKRKPTLLVVDDDSCVLETSVCLLRESGFNVVPESNPAEALKFLAIVPDLDCVVCDFQMPGITGTDLACAAKKIRPAIPVLILSGIDAPESDAQPWDAWLLKGLPISELAERIHLLLKQGESESPGTV